MQFGGGWGGGEVVQGVADETRTSIGANYKERKTKTIRDVVEKGHHQSVIGHLELNYK